jgi:hypothetical protein
MGSKASLSCSSGAITASAEASIKLQLQASGTSAVTWTDGSTCCVEEGGTCQLTICGVQGNMPLDLQLVVSNVTGDPEKLWGIVCIAGNIKAVIKVRCGHSKLPSLMQLHVRVFFFITRGTPPSWPDAQQPQLLGSQG